jgi:hypothetical protein
MMRMKGDCHVLDVPREISLLAVPKHGVGIQPICMVNGMHMQMPTLFSQRVIPGGATEKGAASDATCDPFRYTRLLATTNVV